jgi:small subunit ribosomal protein S15
MLSPELKAQLIKKYAIHTNDTGSLEVQIAILTAEVNDISEHLKQHKKDFSSKRGLIRKVAQRRRFLKELQKEGQERYETLVEKLKSDKTIGKSEIQELAQ